MNDIVDRLKNLAEAFGGRCAEDCLEAADTIEALHARLWNYEHGTAGMCAAAAIGAAEQWQEEVEALRRERDELQADYDRLAEALETEKRWNARYSTVMNVTRADISLMAGELSAQEWRTVNAVLTALRARIGEVK